MRVLRVLRVLERRCTCVICQILCAGGCPPRLYGRLRVSQLKASLPVPSQDALTENQRKDFLVKIDQLEEDRTLMRKPPNVQKML